MEITKFNEKLNKVDGKIHVIEEEIRMPEGGVYEAPLQHDNITAATLNVYTGPKLTGERIQTYALSAPSLTPWKRIIRIQTEEPVVYITYETDGDTVEAEDVNRLQGAVTETQAAINAEADRAKEAEKSLDNGIKAETARAAAAEDEIRGTINANKPNWDDKYTRDEVDNKFSAFETAIDWKETVNTFADLEISYPDPENGWTVNVKDTDYTYRWNGTMWVAISANAIPKATQSMDGLLSKEEKTAYDDAYSKRHTHANKAALDELTQDFLDRGNAAYSHIGSRSNPHGVTKTQVGLENVPNVTTDDQTPTFTQTAELENLSSGEKLTVLLGKIAKAVADYISHKTDTILHLPSGGTAGQVLQRSEDGTAVWGGDSQAKVTQANTTESADYRVVLTGNANDTTETGTVHKSANFQANPATGEFFARGYRRIDLTGQRIDIDTLSLSGGFPGIARYIEKTEAGAADITGIPVSNAPFLLDVELIKWVSAADFITMQTFRSAGSQTCDYVRFCTNGAWSQWTLRGFTDTKYTHPDSGVAAGTYRSVTVNVQGHVTGGSNPTTLAEYGITDAAEKTHNHDSVYLKKGAVTWADLGGG